MKEFAFAKVAGLQPTSFNFTRNELFSQVLLKDFVNFFVTAFLRNTFEWLLPLVFLVIFLLTVHMFHLAPSQPAITYSKLTIQTLVQVVKYVQS